MFCCMKQRFDIKKVPQYCWLNLIDMTFRKEGLSSLQAFQFLQTMEEVQVVVS